MIIVLEQQTNRAIYSRCLRRTPSCMFSKQLTMPLTLLVYGACGHTLDIQMSFELVAKCSPLGCEHFSQWKNRTNMSRTHTHAITTYVGGAKD